MRVLLWGPFGLLRTPNAARAQCGVAHTGIGDLVRRQQPSAAGASRVIAAPGGATSADCCLGRGPPLDATAHGEPRRYRNARVATLTPAGGSRLRGAVNGADFLLLLGGDCSIVLGALLGLRRAGRAPAGLVYIDGHGDYATLDESPTGSACSVSLALAVGRRNSTRPMPGPDRSGG